MLMLGYFRKAILTLGVLVALGLGWGLGEASAQQKHITVSSTTSTQNSGLYDFILPTFTAETGIEVRVVAVGTGAAIRAARKGDADVLLVHHKPSEEKFVAEGYGKERFDLMYNDFVLIGPKSDPAGVRGLTTAAEALTKIAAKKAMFASRGDDSGTNKKELGLWRGTDIDPKAASGTWYRETGSGMGATLNTAQGLSAYVLSDRATWLKFANKGDLEILVEGDPNLFNQYGVILVNPERHPHVKAGLGQRFVDWIISEEGQRLIASYQIKGHQAFFPNANKSLN